MTPIRRFALTAFVALFLALGTATPISAATLTVNWVYCDVYSYSSYYTGHYRCQASVSGGTGRYVSYTWNVTSNRGNYTVVTTTNTFERTCYAGTQEDGRNGESLNVALTVKDSAGATARGYSLTVTCGGMRQ